MEHQIVAFEREGGNQELGAGSVTQSASFLITILERGIDGVHKLVGLQASLSPARVKIRSWMFGKNLSLGATLVHPMFHAKAFTLAPLVTSPRAGTKRNVVPAQASSVLNRPASVPPCAGSIAG